MRILIAIDSSEHNDAAIDETVPTPVRSTPLYSRFCSSGEAQYYDKLLSAMRFQSGGYHERLAT